MERDSHTSLARSWARRQEAPCGEEATSKSKERVERMSEGAALALQQAPVAERSKERVASLWRAGNQTEAGSLVSSV